MGTLGSIGEVSSIHMVIGTQPGPDREVEHQSDKGCGEPGHVSPFKRPLPPSFVPCGNV